jgi:hypothetical protein
MMADGSLPDVTPSAVPMRAVVAATSTLNPDAEAHTQQLAQQAGVGADLARSNPDAARQRAIAADLDRRDLEITNPILARQLQDPSFAAVAHDDLDSLSGIEQGAATMRAQTPSEGFVGRYVNPVFRSLMQYPVTRMGIDAVAGTAGMVGNIGSFLGVHGNGPSRENLGQRIEGDLSPESAGLNVNGRLDTGNALDALVKNVAPMIPAMVASGATAAIADALPGLSENAAKVLAATGVGGMFSADQGGATFTQMAGAGKSDTAARRAANLSAGLNLVPNTAMGLTDFVPFLERNPLLASLGVGGAAGATGQVAQNVVTGQPWQTGVAKNALQSAAVMGGMHIGMAGVDAVGESRQQSQLINLAEQLRTGAPGTFRQSMSDTVNAVEASKLRPRSPEAFQQFANAQFEGDPSLRIPAQDFVNYFAEKKLDPAVAANQVGVTNLEEAAAAGSDLEIPKENFFGKLDPEHQKGLLSDVIDPSTDLSARQAESGRQELEQLGTPEGTEKLARLQAEYAQADAETQATPEWQKVYSDLKQRYVDAGETEPAADSYATLQANAIANLAKGAGLKPDELLALHNPKIVEGAAPDTVLHQSAGDEEPLEGEEQPENAAVEPAAAGPAATESEAAPAQPRGWFRILGHGQYEIGKTKIGDLSTFIHEPAHAYLEMYRDLSARDEVSQPLKDDFKKITDWLGTTPEEAMKDGFTREQHEQWARGNEQYVREGKAPSSGLRRVFHNFGVWMSSIYRRASSLGVELSPEIRDVMDRLYAGEESVNRGAQETGKPLFTSPEEAGWTPEEYRNYAEAKGIGLDKAREQVASELGSAAERERTEQFREEKGNVRDAVTQEIDARPEYKAIRSLRKGELEDAAGNKTELTLNRDALVQQFGEERVKALQKLHPGLYRQEGGTDAETAGDIFGFGSGEEMMRALESAPRRRQAIEAATRDYLTTKYGDVRYDGTLNDRARFAIENDERASNIYREMRALRSRLASVEQKASDSKAAMAAITVEPLDHYQEAARQMIDSKAIADLQPHRYLNASRMFSREAFDALRSGNTRRAAEAKNKELLNHFLYREAMTARDYADKFESYAKRVQSRGIQQRLGLAQESSGVDYRDQFNWLLWRYKLSGPMNAPERPLRDWAEEVYGAGNEPAIAPGILNGSRFADYRSVPLSEVHDLHDALINVRHLAMREFKMYVQGKQVDFADAKNSMMAAARENLRVKPEKIFDENLSAGDRVADMLARGDAMLTRTERLSEWLDGGKQGPWHDNLFNLAADAQGDEYTMQHEVTRTVTDALADMPADMRRRLWTEKVNVDGISEPLSRRRLLSIAFNMGNEGNLDRLRKTFTSFDWDPEAIRKIGGMLTREEWQFVQKTWDSLKSLGERMQELEKRLTGLPPAMVETKPFKVALDDGTEMDLAGGYYPIAMDPRFSQRAIQQDAKETAQNAMQSGYVRAATSRGYTKERTGFGGPLMLDYERVLTSHVAKVAKDLSHREFMLSSQRLLLDTEVRKTLRETLGPAYEQQFMPWLRTIINDRNGSIDQGLGDLSNLMQASRSNIVAASVGFKASTSLLQITHAPRMLLYAKPGSIAQSLVDFLAHPLEMTRQNQELSPNEMRYRGDNLDRDVRAILQNPSYKQGYERKVATAARWTLATVDHLFSHTLWRAAYRDGLANYAELPEGEAQSKAVHEADSAVRLGLGSQAPKDLPAIMRNGDFNKMITVLYGFHNGIYNQLRDNFHQARYDPTLSGLGKLTYATALTAIVPALLGALTTGDGPKDGENPGLWAAKRALLFSADTVPLLGSVAQFMARGQDMQFTPLESVMEKGAKAMMASASDKDDKDWLGIGLNAGEVAGDLAGVPGTGQIVKTARYVHRVNQGKVENPTLWGAIAGGR